MSAVAVILLVCLFVTFGFAAYKLSEARRWHHAAVEARQESDARGRKLEEARRAAIQQQAESAKNRELAEVQLKFLTGTQQQ
jgi:hypothetical protein